jgi:hypothetical protein
MKADEFHLSVQPQAVGMAEWYFQAGAQLCGASRLSKQRLGSCRGSYRIESAMRWGVHPVMKIEQFEHPSPSRRHDYCALDARQTSYAQSGAFKVVRLVYAPIRFSGESL